MKQNNDKPSQVHLDADSRKKPMSGWEYAMVEPALPGDAVSDIDLYLLKGCGFSHVFSEQDGTYLFYTREGIRSPEHIDLGRLNDIQVMDGLDCDVLRVDDPADLPDAVGTFARILRRAGMEELAIKGCYGGDLLQPGIFGGFVIRVTQTQSCYQDTHGILATMAELGGTYPGTETLPNQGTVSVPNNPGGDSLVEGGVGEEEVRDYEVLLYPVMSIVMRDVEAKNWVEAIKAAAEKFTHYNGVWPHNLSFDDAFDRCLVDATGDPDQRVVTRWIYRDELATVLKS